MLQAVKTVLNRPGGRSALGLLISARIWQRRRVWVPVRWQHEGYWLLTYPSAVVLLTEPDATHYEDKEAVAEDAYFHAYRPQQGDVIVHVGAGAGWEANLFSKLVGLSGHVYLIEAHPTTYQWLRRRVEGSGLTNVTTIHIAVSDEPGDLHLSDVADHMLNQLRPEGQGVSVTAQTLEQIFSLHSIEHVDLLTMNIEGAERDAIRGMGPVASSVERLAISCHDFLADRGGDDWTRTKADVEKMLTEFGYDVTHRDAGDTRDWTRAYLYAQRSRAHP